MWLLRRRLYRDPARRRRPARAQTARAQKVVSDRRGRAKKNLEITVTRAYEVEERGRNSESRVMLPQLDPPLSARWASHVAKSQRNTL